MVYSSEGYEATIDVKTWAVRNDSLLFALPMEPDFGMVVDVVVGANVVRDINGNMNVAFATENAWLRSYGLEVDDVEGQYIAAYYGYDFDIQGFNTEVVLRDTLSIVADEETENLIYLDGLFGQDSIPAMFDGDYATITVKHGTKLSVTEKYTWYLIDAINGEDIVFNISTETGKIKTSGYPSVGAYTADGLAGYGVISAACTLTPWSGEDAQ